MTSQVSPDGRRIVKIGNGRTKSEAKLKKVLRDHEGGLAIPPAGLPLAELPARLASAGPPVRRYRCLSLPSILTASAVRAAASSGVAAYPAKARCSPAARR